MSASRWWAAVVLLLAAAVTEYALPRAETTVGHPQLQNLPSAIADWTAVDIPIDARLVNFSRVDNYLNRAYHRAPADEVGVYIGYYKSQRAGDSVHSPKNCLPGAGWQPVYSSRIMLPLLPQGRPAEVNLYTVENEHERLVVLYWYQTHGRIVASEYAAKYYTVRDAILLHRTDSALVRITVPASGDEARARQSAIAFAILIAPKLEEVIPR
jgi:EpsI family protein